MYSVSQPGTFHVVCNVHLIYFNIYALCFGVKTRVQCSDQLGVTSKFTGCDPFNQQQAAAGLI